MNSTPIIVIANLTDSDTTKMMNCKSVLFITVLLLLPGQWVFASENVRLLVPDVQLRDISLVTLNLERAKLLIDLKVENPNASDIVVEEIIYRLTLNNTEVNQGRIQLRERFPANSVRSVKVPVTLAYDQHLPAILNALNSTVSPDYEIAGGVKLEGYKKPFSFHHKDKLVLCAQC